MLMLHVVFAAAAVAATAAVTAAAPQDAAANHTRAGFRGRLLGSKGQASRPPDGDDDSGSSGGGGDDDDGVAWVGNMEFGCQEHARAPCEFRRFPAINALASLDNNKQLSVQCVVVVPRTAAPTLVVCHAMGVVRATSVSSCFLRYGVCHINRIKVLAKPREGPAAAVRRMGGGAPTALLHRAI